MGRDGMEYDTVHGDIVFLIDQKLMGFQYRARGLHPVLVHPDSWSSEVDLTIDDFRRFIIRAR
jgi:hypothetical protein